MATHNPDNERVKRRYFAFLKEAKGQSEDSRGRRREGAGPLRGRHPIPRLQGVPLRAGGCVQEAAGRQNSQTTGGKLSKATLNATLAHLKRFFQWLAGQPGYKSRLQYSDAEYFNLSDKDTRVATARRERPAPTLEQVRHVISLMPSQTEIERRNRALVAFTLLTGARDSAIASMKLKHVDLAAGNVVPGCPRREDQVQQDLHDLLLPGRRRGAPDRR